MVSLESELVRRTQGPLPALRLVENYVDENWWHHAAWLAEGRLYAENNDVTQSTRALRYAAMLDVHDVNALDLLARNFRYVKAGSMTRIATQRRAVARQPYEPRQYLMLAEILDKMGRTTEAQKARDKVARLASDGSLAADRGQLNSIWRGCLHQPLLSGDAGANLPR